MSRTKSAVQYSRAFHPFRDEPLFLYFITVNGIKEFGFIYRKFVEALFENSSITEANARVMKNIHKIIIILLIFSSLAGIASGMRLPETDADGNKLFAHPTVSAYIREQNNLMLLMIVLMIVLVIAIIVMGLVFIRFQNSMNLINQSMMRIDVLSRAVRETSLEWAQQVKSENIVFSGARAEEEKDSQLENIDDKELIDMFVKGVENRFSDS